MVLKKIRLVNFRNFADSLFSFSPELTIIVGENARGKTNLLESVYFFMNGTGFRESREEELMKMGTVQSTVDGILAGDGVKMNLKVVLAMKEGMTAKSYFVDKVRKRYFEYIREQTKAVLFSPEQIKIITDAPDLRREYLNRTISFYDLDYKKRLANYENAVRRRNKILEHTPEQLLKQELEFWNNYLVEQGSYLTRRRGEYVDFLNSHPKLDGKSFRLDYRKNELTPGRWEKVLSEEKRLRRTLIGPQKDDFQIYMTGDPDKNIHHFGSRSEQRLAIMWLKMSEVRHYEETSGKKPILLLDDVFSELDEKNKDLVLRLVGEYQTVLTTTEDDIFSHIRGKTETIRI